MAYFSCYSFKDIPITSSDLFAEQLQWFDELLGI